MSYVLLQIALHGVEIESLEEVLQTVDTCLRPTFGQRFQEDIEIEPIESAGLLKD